MFQSIERIDSIVFSYPAITLRIYFLSQQHGRKMSTNIWNKSEHRNLEKKQSTYNSDSQPVLRGSLGVPTTLSQGVREWRSLVL